MIKVRPFSFRRTAVVVTGHFWNLGDTLGSDRFAGRSPRPLRLSPERQVKFSIANQKIHVIDDDGVHQEL
jgi:hypothetical protein